MPAPITAADVDQFAANLDIQLTPWQRDTLVDACAMRRSTGRWPILIATRRNGLATIRRISRQLATDREA
ncbi:hypothetical protein [Amycolatopsis circi]|uniref:hypothetical protein n=1 Tax=Amycolatopsis circi TaxID=871959 RepID=UPI000E26799A|nr:hypothetical protein [Amycolatopsis circi]